MPKYVSDCKFASINFYNYYLNIFISEWRYTVVCCLWNWMHLNICFIWWQIAHLEEMEWPWKQACTECCYNAPSVRDSDWETVSQSVCAVLLRYLRGSGICTGSIAIQTSDNRSSIYLRPRGPCIKHSQTRISRSGDRPPSSLVDLCTCVKTQFAVVNFDEGAKQDAHFIVIVCCSSFLSRIFSTFCVCCNNWMNNYVLVHDNIYK